MFVTFVVILCLLESTPETSDLIFNLSNIKFYFFI